MQKERKRRPLRTALIIILIIVLIILIAMPFGLAYFVMAGGKRSTLDAAMKWQSEYYDTSFYDELEKTDSEKGREALWAVSNTREDRGRAPWEVGDDGL